jgi:hypothetical protein
MEKKFENFLKYRKLEKIDDYGEIVDAGNGYKKYINSENNNLISESSLNRIISLRNKDWVIISAHRLNKTKRENIQRNRILRGILNDMKMGVHQLVGHWKECTIPNMTYDECPENKLEDTIERSYYVVKPDNMDKEKFLNMMLNLLEIDGEKQDALVYHDSEEDIIYVMDENKNIFEEFKNWKLGEIGQAYSQHVKKMNVPFKFEGLEIPSNNMGALIMDKLNIKYLK